MKKLILLAAVAVFGLSNAQFKLGAHVGLPVGDAKDAGLDFNAGIDVAYLWPVADGFKLGVTTGYSHYFGKKETYSFMGYTYEVDPSGGIVPLAATAQYAFPSSKFFLGADLGYAFFTGEGSDGGAFYYQPKVGYSFTDTSDLYLSYKGASKDGATLSSINLGYAYTFGK